MLIQFDEDLGVKVRGQDVRGCWGLALMGQEVEFESRGQALGVMDGIKIDGLEGNHLDQRVRIYGLEMKN